MVLSHEFSAVKCEYGPVRLNQTRHNHVSHSAELSAKRSIAICPRTPAHTLQTIG